MAANKLLIISLILIIGGIILKDPFSSVTYGPGVIAPDDPIQNSTDAEPFFLMI